MRNIKNIPVPLVMFGILFVIYGWTITDLGFYQDDWHFVYFAHALGLPRLWELLGLDGRPLAAIFYIAAFSVLGFALGTLYPKNDESIDLNYWFKTLQFYTDIEALIPGKNIQASKTFRRFQGSSLDSLLVYYPSEKRQCLWVLKPDDAVFQALPDDIRQVAAISNLTRIHLESPLEGSVPVEIFGEEPEHNWCNYFQRAELAVQFQDWNQASTLWDELQKENLRSIHGKEYLPFIQGLAQTGRWAEAEQLSRKASQLTPRMRGLLCNIWLDAIETTEDSTMRAEAVQQIEQKFSCWK